ncbi:hypothetical protein N7532_001287 [Penicillium argentinense]|uniref:Ubiquitin carboxyl-terminal hydrolase n=1 Tax=Penicillium argentinense TaxID=1131581 RepID=A0A9W9G3T3_9EURO|nr:uncharacterized protein N7532_001287 [Penicillium argentinense]KAJ5110752.1 hypothetical protein N7532_001287 [Penicillium argentinense]
MGPPSKRRRLADPAGDCSDEICQSATHLEKTSWNGFCEIESEPALFNVMLREFGVRGVKVQEVVSLEEEMMVFLNKPIYGLIFLFRWREDDVKKQEATCPDGIWFANQTASNACASVAMLNIVNNIPNIDLGENLRHFKEFTMPFTPALRGDAINNFEFVKRVHNSFARKMDILNADLQLRTDASPKKSSKSSSQDLGEAEAAFHFIAFMPALGQVWKFDGLERQPHSLGECAEEDWLELAKPDILKRMAAYEQEQIEFSILGLVRDPLPDLQQELAINIRSLEIITDRLTNHPSPLVSHLAEQATTLKETESSFGPDTSLGLTRAMIDAALAPDNSLSQYREASLPALIQHQETLRSAQRDLRLRLREEQQMQQADDEHAKGRRYDYGPAVRTWLRCLARKQQLAELLPRYN